MISVDVSHGVMTIVLDRPDHLNAITFEMVDHFIAALDQADADDDVRVVVVTGRGRAFCAGADMSAGAASFDSGTEVARDGGGVLALRVFALHKPVIGAINGPAFGGGASITLPMDIRLASTKARFGFPYVRRGIVPEGCASWFLPRVVGISTAVEWTLTGRMIDTGEALRRGLVSSVHEPDELLSAAYSIAREIADSTAPVSVALSRQMMWQLLGASHPMVANEIESIAVRERAASPDGAEGVNSFLEKRPPRFVSRVSDQMPQFYPWWTEPEFGRSLNS